eukprot:6729926-Prymnesium_polylepis.1
MVVWRARAAFRKSLSRAPFAHAALQSCGGALHGTHHIRVAIGHAMGKRPWVFQNLQLLYQTDEWNCGVWLHVMDENITEYIDSSYFGQRMLREFLAQDRRCRPLNMLGAAEVRFFATERNARFIDRMRNKIREYLLEEMAGRMLHASTVPMEADAAQPQRWPNPVADSNAR